MPAACSISHTVDGATARPSFVSSPWIRRYPHSGFSFASRMTRRAMPGTVGGRPALRRLLVSYLAAASLRCQASSVAGVRRKISAQRLRGMSRASAANHTLSAGSYRTRPRWRRSTAFSCRSTRSSAAFARSPRNTRTATPSTQHVSRYTILSSTRQANHHRVEPAGYSAGQALNRVFGRHRFAGTPEDELLDRLAASPALAGSELTFLRARIAERRGDATQAATLVTECLRELPGHQGYLDFAVEVGAELPPRARELLYERARILSDALTRPEPRGRAHRVP